MLNHLKRRNQGATLLVFRDIGVCAIINEMMEAARSDDVVVRRAACTMVCFFCSHTRADYSQYVPLMLKELIHLYTDEDTQVLQVSWEALDAVTKSLYAKKRMEHVNDVRQAVRFALSDLKGNDLLPGFCLPKGLTPILSIFQEGIWNGTPEVKEQAVQGLGEVIRLTSAEALQPLLARIFGPLLFILGKRLDSSIVAAMMETLTTLLAKVGVMMRPFVPQLQTTFLMTLNNTDRQVRLKAAVALEHLIVIHPRADPLFRELHTGVSAEDPAIRETMLQALRGVITPAGDKMSVTRRNQVYETLIGLLSHPEDITRSAAAGCLGALSRWLTPEQLYTTLTDHMLQDDVSTDWSLRHGRSAALMVALKEGPGAIYTELYSEKINTTLLGFLAADRVPIVMNGVRGLGYLFQYMMTNNVKIPQKLLSPFCRTMNHTNNEVKRLVAQVCSYLARVLGAELAPEFLKAALPMLVNGTKEKNGHVKASSELSLVAVLRLRHGDAHMQHCLNLLDGGVRDALSDVIAKKVKKVALQPEGKEGELDDTLAT